MITRTRYNRIMYLPTYTKTVPYIRLYCWELLVSVFSFENDSICIPTFIMFNVSTSKRKTRAKKTILFINMRNKIWFNHQFFIYHSGFHVITSSFVSLFSCVHLKTRNSEGIQEMEDLWSIIIVILLRYI